MRRSVALFLPHFVPNMSPWMLRPIVTLSAKGLWGIEYNWVSTTNSGGGLAEFQGDSALWSWNASRTSCPSVRQTEREREQERPEATSERRAALLLIHTDLFHTNMLTWAAWGSNTNALGRQALPAEIRKIRTVTSAFVVIRGALICSVFISSKVTPFKLLCWKSGDLNKANLESSLYCAPVSLNAYRRHDKTIQGLNLKKEKIGS